MSFLIAVSGKGGVGKTTVAGLLITRLIHHGRKPVLAIDADPNSCLDLALGVKVKKTLGGVREEARELSGAGAVTGIGKQELLEMKISESLVEADDFDLIAMGRPEGPGCYCYANNVLRSAVSQITANYPYAVLDNEAGLENLSRRIVQKVDLLVMVSDPSRAGLETVRRLHALAHDMNVTHDRVALIVNRVRSCALPPLAEEIASVVGADAPFIIPDDAELASAAELGKTLFMIKQGGPAVAAIDGFCAATGLA